MKPALRRLHAASAALIGLFIAVHMANHLVGLFGEQRHIAFMHAARTFYRLPLIELPLLLLFGWQAISGLTMVMRGWRGRTGAIAWAQALSGGYLAVFLLIHIAAVLSGRSSGIDTDVRFAGEGLGAGLAWFFIPYYGLAVTALATHLGCALYWARGGREPRLVGGAVAAGAIFAALILMSLGGVFFPVHPHALQTASNAGPVDTASPAS